jgi:hypothetical protein
LAFVLSVSTGLPSVALAGRNEPVLDESTYEQAKTLYEKGRGSFETADYETAIETWTEAYTMLPSSHESARIKALLLYDIATAQELAFEVDGEASHLRQAKILLESFEQNIPALYGEGIAAEEERGRVRERIGVLEDKIARAEDKATSDDRSDEDEAPTSSAETPTDHTTGKPLVVTGASLMAVGVASLGLMAAGLVMGNQANDISDIDEDDVESRRDQFDRGRTGNVLAIVGGAAGGALAVAGTVLVILGKRRPSRAALTPTLGPAMAGAAIVGRF